MKMAKGVVLPQAFPLAPFMSAQTHVSLPVARHVIKISVQRDQTEYVTYLLLSVLFSVSLYIFWPHTTQKVFLYHPAMAYSHMLSVLSATKTMWCWGAVAMNLVMTFSFWDLYLLDSGGMLDLGYEQTATHRLNRFWVTIEGDSNRNPNSRCFWVFAHKIHHPAHLASICRIHTLLFIG